MCGKWARPANARSAERGTVEPGADDLHRAGAFTGTKRSRRAIRARKMMSASSAFSLISRRNSGMPDLQRPPGPRHPGDQVRPLTGQEAQLAEEPALAVHDDEHVAGRIRTQDLDLAVEHHPEVVRLVGRAEQDVADVDVIS